MSSSPRVRNAGRVPVRCGRCERGLWSANLLPGSSSARAVWGANRPGDLMCDRCGAVLPMGLVTERLLRKLLQLQRFGLVGAEKPLLGPEERDA